MAGNLTWCGAGDIVGNNRQEQVSVLAPKININAESFKSDFLKGRKNKQPVSLAIRNEVKIVQSISDMILEARRKIITDEALEEVTDVLKKVSTEERQKIKELLSIFLKGDISPSQVDRFTINTEFNTSYNGLWCKVNFEYGKVISPGGTNIKAPNYLVFIIKFDNNKIVDILMSSQDPEKARFEVGGRRNIFVRLNNDLFDSQENRSLLLDAIGKIKRFDSDYSFATARPGSITIDLDKNLFLSIKEDEKHHFRDNSYFIKKINEMLESPIAPIFAWLLTHPKLQGLCFSKDVILLDQGMFVGGQYIESKKLILGAVSAFDHEFFHHVYHELILPDREIFEEILNFAETNDPQGLEEIKQFLYSRFGTTGGTEHVLNEWFAYKLSLLLDNFVATKGRGIWLSPIQCQLIEKLIELNILPPWLNPKLLDYKPGGEKYAFTGQQGRSYDQLVLEYLLSDLQKEPSADSLVGEKSASFSEVVQETHRLIDKKEITAKNLTEQVIHTHEMVEQAI
ncbi:MAG: hypothetical protein KJ893_03305 [Candidatus Omnitrophica bacterium]|nr:hypothetical protein [Candidatus Omnitrophota bacterium]